ALDSVVFPGALGACYKVDACVLAAEPLLLRPVGVCPHLVVQVTVGRFVAQVYADEFFEVGAFFAFGDRGGAVSVEQSGESGHARSSFRVTAGAMLAPNGASLSPTQLIRIRVAPCNKQLSLCVVV